MGKKKGPPQRLPIFAACDKGDVAGVRKILDDIPSQIGAKNNVRSLVSRPKRVVARAQE
jgi:hypothetical protein